MAYNFSLRARKLAWSNSDEKLAHNISQIRRVGTDSTLADDDDSSISTSIRRISASEDIGRFMSALKKDGCVVVEDFTDIQTLGKAIEEVKPWLQTQESSQGLTPLIKQSPTIRNSFLANNVYQELCEEFLAVETTRWRDDRQTTEVCRPILSSVRTTKVPPAGTDQALNRRDVVFGLKHDSVDKYKRGRDSMLGLIVPGSRSVRVRTVLGSHLCGSYSPDFDKLAVEEELEAGEALIVLGSHYYYIAADAEQQANAQPTLVHNLWSCAGIYRPEEPSALVISAAEVKTYPSVVQERLQ